MIHDINTHNLIGIHLNTGWLCATSAPIYVRSNFERLMEGFKTKNPYDLEGKNVTTIFDSNHMFIGLIPTDTLPDRFIYR